MDIGASRGWDDVNVKRVHSEAQAVKPQDLVEASQNARRKGQSWKKHGTPTQEHGYRGKDIRRDGRAW